MSVIERSFASRTWHEIKFWNDQGILEKVVSEPVDGKDYGKLIMQAFMGGGGDDQRYSPASRSSREWELSVFKRLWALCGSRLDPADLSPYLPMCAGAWFVEFLLDQGVDPRVEGKSRSPKDTLVVLLSTLALYQRENIDHSALPSYRLQPKSPIPGEEIDRLEKLVDRCLALPGTPLVQQELWLNEVIRAGLSAQQLAQPSQCWVRWRDQLLDAGVPVRLERGGAVFSWALAWSSLLSRYGRSSQALSLWWEAHGLEWQSRLLEKMELFDATDTGHKDVGLGLVWAWLSSSPHGDAVAKRLMEKGLPPPHLVYGQALHGGSTLAANQEPQDIITLAKALDGVDICPGWASLYVKDHLEHRAGRNVGRWGWASPHPPPPLGVDEFAACLSLLRWEPGKEFPSWLPGWMGSSLVGNMKKCTTQEKKDLMSFLLDAGVIASLAGDCSSFDRSQVSLRYPQFLLWVQGWKRDTELDEIVLSWNNELPGIALMFALLSVDGEKSRFKEFMEKAAKTDDSIPGRVFGLICLQGDEKKPPINVQSYVWGPAIEVILDLGWLPDEHARHSMVSTHIGKFLGYPSGLGLETGQYAFQLLRKARCDAREMGVVMDHLIACQLSSPTKFLADNPAVKQLIIDLASAGARPSVEMDENCLLQPFIASVIQSQILDASLGQVSAPRRRRL